MSQCWKSSAVPGSGAQQDTGTAQLQELPGQQGSDTSMDSAALPGSAPAPAAMEVTPLPCLPFPCSSSSCSMRNCCSHSHSDVLARAALREVTTPEFPLSDLQVKIKLLLSKHKNPIVLFRELQSPTARTKSHFSPHLCWR